MATNYFVISFSIKYDEDYSERRNSLLDAIRGHGKTYEDTTSFVILKTGSEQSSVELSMRISKINMSKDSLVILQCFSSTFKNYGKAKPLKFT